MQTRTVPERSSSDLQQTVSRCSDAADRGDHEETQDVGQTNLGLGEAQEEEVVRGETAGNSQEETAAEGDWSAAGHMITVLISDWLRQVISTKARRRRKVAQVTACGDCGDFHARRSDVCRVRELRVKMLVQQIMGTSKDIKVCNIVVVAAFNQEKALVGAFSVIVHFRLQH